MWPFGKREKRKPTPETDPVGVVCELLLSEPLAWSSSKPSKNGSLQVLTHVTGVVIGIHIRAVHDDVTLSYGDTHQELTTHDSIRVRGAILQRTATILAAKRANPTQTARALAQAVLDGNTDAIWPLIDYLLETRNRPTEQQDD